MSEEIDIGQQKFDTCRHRSSGLEEVGEFSCCVNTLRMAYVCYRRSIDDLSPANCAGCEKFKEKINNE
jgi:hypothetical protein